MPGYQVEILDPSGKPMPAGEEGLIVMKLPLPPGTMATVWGDDSRFVSSVPVGIRRLLPHRRFGYLDEDGYVFVMGRTDDVINVAGHRLSTGVIEAVIASHPAVTETAVIGVHDDTKGQSPRALVVLGDSAEAAAPETVIAELVALVRKEIGPMAAFKQVDIVSALPKTRSGKILRKTIREIADGVDSSSSALNDRGAGPCSTTWRPCSTADRVLLSTPLRPGARARLELPVTGGGFDTTGRFGSPRGGGAALYPED